MARKVKKKKKVNSKLLTILLVIAVPILLIMAIAVDSKRPFLPRAVHKILGRDPGVLLEKGKVALDNLEDYYRELKGQVDAIEDPALAAQKWETLLQEDFSDSAKKVYQIINDAKRFSKGDVEMQIEALNEFVRFHKITENDAKAVASWNSIVKYDVNNYEAWKNLGEYYLEFAGIYLGGESLVKLEEVGDILIELKPEDSYGYCLKAMSKAYRLISGLSDDVIADKESAAQLCFELQEKYPADLMVARSVSMYNKYLTKEATSLFAKQEILASSAKLLKDTIAENPDNAEAYTAYFDNYLAVYLDVLKQESKIVDTPEQIQQIQKEMQEFTSAALSEYSVAVLKFPDNPDIKVSKANFMSTIANTDFSQEISLYQEAVALEPDNIIWHSVLGKLYFITYDSADESMDKLMKAREHLRKAYYLYEQKVSSIEGRKIIIIRSSEVMPFLALTNLMLIDSVDQAGEELEKITQELKENKGDTSALTIACLGLQAMAKGDIETATQKLYDAVNRENTNEFSALFLAEIRWKLFELLKDGQYKMEALQNAVIAYGMRARSGQEFVEIIDVYLKVRTAKAKQEILQLIDYYGKRYQADQEISDQLKRQQAQALLSLGRKDEAVPVVADIVGDSYEIEYLRCQIIEDPDMQLAAVEALAKKYPGKQDVVNYLYGKYLASLKDDPSYKEKLIDLFDKAIAADPDNYYFVQESLKVNEPDPLQVSAERLFELQLKAIESVKDDFERYMTYGRIYSVQLTKANLEDETKELYLQKTIEYYNKAMELKSDDPEPYTAMLTTWLGQENFEEAEAIISQLRDVDSFRASFAEIDLLVAKEEFEQAEEKLVAYLNDYPLSASGHLVLAKVYSSLGRKADAVRELETSLRQNRFNADAILDYIILQNQEYEAAGLQNLGPEKIQSMMGWIEQLMNVSPGNIQGVRFFVRYAPLWARELDSQVASLSANSEAIESYKQTVKNIEAMLVRNINILIDNLGDNEGVYILCANSLDTISQLSSLAGSKQSYVDAISKIYQQGMTAVPGGSAIASNYEIFLRRTGQESGVGLDKLKQMLSESEGEEHFNTVLSLARLYFTDGEIDLAVELLNKEIQLTDDLDRRHGLRSMLAMIYKSTGDHEKVLNVYTQQRKEKDSDELMTLHIEALMDAGFNDQAEPMLEEMAQKYPDDHKVYLLKSKYALRETNYVQAVEFADKALEISPGEKAGLQLKSQALFYDDKLYEAVQAITEMRESFSDDSNEGRAMLAQIYARMRKYDDAIIELRKGLEVEPGNVQLNNMMANILKNRKRWNELVGYYKKQMRVFPNRYSSYSNCAQAYMLWADDLKQQGNESGAQQKYSEALAILDGVINSLSGQNVTNAGLIDTRLEILIATGRYDEVLASLNSNEEVTSSNPQLLLRKMEALYLSGETAQATEVLTEIMDAFGGGIYIESLVEKAVRVFEASEIIEWADKHAASFSKPYVCYMLKASACRNSGDYDCYVEFSSKAFEAIKDNPQMEIILTSRLAIAYIQAEKYEPAIELYRELCEKVPSSYSLLNNYAYALLSSGGHAKEALDVALKAYSIARLEPMVLDTYGMALLQNDMPDKAGQVFSKAIQEMQRNNNEVPVEFEYHQAQAMVASQRQEEAAEMLEDLLRRAKLSRSKADLNMVDDVEKLLSEIKN